MKPLPSRREFLRITTVLGAAAALRPAALVAAESAGAARKMRLCLTPGSIGVKGDLRAIIGLAHKHGFEAVEPVPGFLVKLSAAELADVLADLKAKELVFGTAGLPVDFRGEEAKFRAGLEGLGAVAAGLQRAGVTRVGTWITPAHNTLAFAENFRQHAGRLREVAKVIGDHGLRLGLEYVGTPTSRAGRPHAFIHSMREMRELIAEIGTGNVGLVLDSWHWWTAGETEADLLALKASDVVSVDLNDAPAGIPVEKQLDGQRELPCATGVIPAGVFVNALQRLGYDGPVRAEPFNKAVNAMSADDACAAAIGALRQAMALLK